VEGASDEFRLFRHILTKILHYGVMERSRNCNTFKKYDKYVAKSNSRNRFILINTENSPITTIGKHNDYRNNIYKTLVTIYKIDPTNSPVYYTWDRDRESNNNIIVHSLLQKLYNPYGDDKFNYENGLLLLSYPALEAYKISCFSEAKSTNQVKLKAYCTKHHYWHWRINEHCLLKATEVMERHINALGIGTVDFDNMRKPT